MKRNENRSGAAVIALLALLLPCVTALCVCAGSVAVPLLDTCAALWRALRGLPAPEGDMYGAIILSIRLPRVLCAALTGAALALSGAAMQGLLRNPLADGSTLGVSAGASLGAVAAIAFGSALPGFGMGGVMGAAMATAFASLLAVLALAYALDKSLATGSIILIGVIFSMFASSLISLVTAFAGEKVKTITFWTMGSLSGGNYGHALALLAALLLCGGVLLSLGRELNVFALGEENARQIGVNVKWVKIAVLAAASALIGMCVAVGGSIGFVGLVAPHITRFLTGPDHKKLLPASALLGAVFVLLADLIARTVLSPVEMPIGVVTSLTGSVFFVVIFWRARRKERGQC